MAAASGLSRENMFIAEMEVRNIPTSALIDVRFVHGVCVISHTGGHTPMFYAVQNDWCAAIDWLLKKGASRSLRAPSLSTQNGTTDRLFPFNNLVKVGSRCIDDSFCVLRTL